LTIYGTKIKSDIEFPLDLSQKTESRHEVELSAQLPESLKRSITCGFPLYWAHGRRVYLYSDRLFDESTHGQPWCYDVPGVVKFYWLGGERKIYYTLEEEGDARLLAFWFTHLLFPFYLNMEEIYDLIHCGSVEIEGSPIAFIAPSTGGKSTLTDYFIRQGHTMFTDDKLPTFIEHGRFMAVGSHPYHRPYRRFEDLGFRVERFADRIKPLAAFYLLKRNDARAPVAIRQISGFSKFTAIEPNYLFSFPWQRKKRLAYLSSMLSSVKVYEVDVPWDMERLDEVYRAIKAHAAKNR